jgi:hypothetical protein
VEATAVTLHEVGGCADGDGTGAALRAGTADAVVVAAGRGCPTGCADSWDMLTTAATRAPRATMPSAPSAAENQFRFAMAAGPRVAFISVA